MSERPEWVRCIRHTHEELKTTSWCGRDLNPMGFLGEEGAFTSIDHAAYHARRDGRYVACAACVKAIADNWRDVDKDPQWQVEPEPAVEALTEEQIDAATSLTDEQAKRCR